MKKVFKRIFPFILASLLLVFTAFPASAAGYDSNSSNVKIIKQFDYKVEPTNNNLFQVEVYSGGNVFWERYLDGQLKYTYTGNIWAAGLPGGKYFDNLSYVVYPFGDRVYLDLKGVTDISDVSSYLMLNFTSSLNVSFTMRIRKCYNFRMSSGQITQTTVPGEILVDVSPSQTNYLVEFSDDTLAGFDEAHEYPVMVYYKIDFINLSSQSASDQINFSFSAEATYNLLVDQAYAEYLDSSLVKDQLDGIGGQLDETNDKLDDIINGDLDPVAPGGSGDVNNTMDAEDALLDNAIGNWEQSESVFSSALSSIKTIAASLVVVARIMDRFVRVPIFSILIYLSLSLGVLSSLLNIGESISRKISKGSASGKRRR